MIVLSPSSVDGFSRPMLEVSVERPSLSLVAQGRLMALPEDLPPLWLIHGTDIGRYESIRSKGLLPGYSGPRVSVHMAMVSPDVDDEDNAARQ